MTDQNMNISSSLLSLVSTILLLVALIVSGCMSYRITESSINMTSSNPQKIKIIKFEFVGNLAMTLVYELMEPWDHILVNLTVTCKTGNGKTRKLTGIDKLDYCSFFESHNSIKNPFVRNMFQSARKIEPNFFKKCPMTGVISMINYTDKNFINIAPMGKYVIKSRMYNNQPGVKQEKLDFSMSFTLVAD